MPSSGSPSSFSSLEERARAFAVAQDFGSEALDLNRRLITANPTDAGARTRLARCYLQAGRIDEAEAEYQEALRQNPRNRIAIGGLEEIERLRQPPPARLAESRRAASREGRTASRAAAGRAQRIEPIDANPSPLASEPVPESFAGFGTAEFTELACCRRRDAQQRFGPRVIDLVRRVNALGSAVEIAGIREPGRRQMFRTSRADVHAAGSHWHVSNFGGRGEPRCDIGMYGGRAIGNWLRIGLGFDLTEDADQGPDFARFQNLVASPRGSLFLGWMVKEDARPQIDDSGPMLDVHEPSEAASLIAAIDPARTKWLFFGKWLRPEHSPDAAALADPVSLVRTIDRVFTGLTPLWRALYEGGQR